MVEIENIQKLVMEELDLSREVCDEELQEVIHRVLERDADAKYLRFVKRLCLGRNFLIRSENWTFCRRFWRMMRLRRL